MKKTIALIILCLLTGAVFAGVNGVVGDSIIKWFVDYLKVDPEKALTLFGTILTAIGIMIRFALKKIPTKTSGIIGFVVWHVAAFLFGDGVKLENHSDTEYVRDQLKKKYPLLNIEIPK